MRVVYSDECGIGDIKKEPITVVTAIMMNLDSQWTPLQRDFTKLPATWLGRRELHGIRLLRDLRKSRGKHSGDVLAAVASMPSAHGLQIFSGAVDRAGFRRVKESILHDQDSNWDEYFAAFLSCMRRVDDFMHTAYPSEKVLWIADESERHRSRLKMSLTMQQALTQLPENPNRPDFKRFESHLSDTIYFGRSHESRALQLADICCSLIEAHLRGDPIAEPYYSMIRPNLTREPVAEFVTQPDYVIMPMRMLPASKWRKKK
jgi:uncharacterized protein DUF3800